MLYMLDDIIRMTESLKKDMESNIPDLDKEIDRMIENREESSQRIEGMLDILLDHLYMDVGKDQFIRLNSYYSTICPDYSAEYSRFYDEIIGS